jgi:Fe-S-cluster containining protein
MSNSDEPDRVATSDRGDANPCKSCGARCTLFRVSFYWGEADDAPGGYVPADLTVQVNPTMRAMHGTHPRATGCVALQGTPGECVSCGIYERRPTTCREFDTHDEHGHVDERCTVARAALGLPALSDLNNES